MRKNRLTRSTRYRRRLFKTLIFVRGYCSDFEIVVKKNHFLTIEEATRFIHKEIMNTSMIKGIIHYTSRGEVYVPNNDFVHPEITFKLNNYDN